MAAIPRMEPTVRAQWLAELCMLPVSRTLAHRRGHPLCDRTAQRPLTRWPTWSR